MRRADFRAALYSSGVTIPSASSSFNSKSRARNESLPPLPLPPPPPPPLGVSTVGHSYVNTSVEYNAYTPAGGTGAGGGGTGGEGGVCGGWAAARVKVSLACLRSRIDCTSAFCCESTATGTCARCGGQYLRRREREGGVHVGVGKHTHTHIQNMNL